MPRIVKRMLIAAGLLLLAIFVAVAMQIDDWSRDLTTNRAATSQDASDPLLHTLEVSATPEEVEAAITQFVESSPAWSFYPDKTSTPQEIYLVRTSRLFHFADDVRVFLEPSKTGTRIDAASQSRLGKGDLGQNPRNLRELLQALRKEFNLPQPTS